MGQIRLTYDDHNRRYADEIHKMGWKELAEPPSPLALLEQEYDVIVDAGNCAGPIIRSHRQSIGIAILVHDLPDLNALLGANGTSYDILFKPDRLAVLDAKTANRVTLKTAAALDKGHTLTANDIAIERNGGGISVQFKSSVIGQMLAYPLGEDAAIDFGMLQ